MKASDLMIGDWVQVPSELNRYKRLRSTFDMDEAVLYEPIPLTLEILEKNGLTRESDGKIVAEFFEEDDKGNLEISADSKGIWWTINYWEYEILCFKYVHELQHALKLCGINKDITL